jgi:hypothetical protein
MSSASGHRQVMTQNLTFGASSIQAAVQRPVVNASNVPKAVNRDWAELTFTTTAAQD